MSIERRRVARRKFGYYMPVLDGRTHETIGYLSDISPQGFRIESQKPLALEADYPLRLDVTPEISSRSNIVFLARAKWTTPDPITPFEFVHGFELISITPDDYAIFKRLVEKYGRP